MNVRFLIAILLGTALLGGGFWWWQISQDQKSEQMATEQVTLPAENFFSDRISEPPIPAPPIPVQNVQNDQKKIAAVSQPAKELLENLNCQGGSFEKFQCFRRYYEAIVQEDGPKEAMLDLQARYSDSFVHSQCHQLAHIVGRAAAGLYPNVSEAFGKGDPFCWSGYYHGVMETSVAGVPREELAARLDDFCKEIPGKEAYSFDYYNCVHGLGHGIMSIFYNELPDSLEFCNNLNGGWEQSSCWSGVFMENIIADEINHAAKYLKNDDPLYPCNATDKKYRITCYLMQTSRMLDLVGGDFAKVFELCRGVENDYQNICFQSLGRDASGKSVSEVSKTRETCLLGKDYHEQSNCIIGAIKDFISYHHSDAQARQLCASLPQNLQQVCTLTAEDYYKLF